MQNYHCTKCAYKFERKVMPTRCPYCGVEGTIEHVKSAQSLLDELTEETEVIEQSRKERESFRTSR